MYVNIYDNIPIFQGYYVVNNYKLDDRQLPPFIPGGRYRIQMAILYDGYIMASGSAYIEIIYKMKR